MNSENTVQLLLDTDVEITLSGGGLNGVYSFLQLQFYWGSDDSKGSEHTIDGKR